VSCSYVARVGENSIVTGLNLPASHHAAYIISAYDQGLFVGASVEAATLVHRSDANRDFYGRRVQPKELLLGGYAPPVAAEPLYRAIAEVRSAYCNTWHVPVAHSRLTVLLTVKV
jgi:lipid-binding SYLF domain-containing protein